MKTKKMSLTEALILIPGLPYVPHLNVLGAVIPGHIVKTRRMPYLPICSVSRGGGSKGPVPQEVLSAYLAHAANHLPKLVKAIQAMKGEPGPAEVKALFQALAKAESIVIPV